MGAIIMVNLEELRAMAKAKGIKHSHLMGENKLREVLADELKVDTVTETPKTVETKPVEPVVEETTDPEVSDEEKAMADAQARRNAYLSSGGTDNLGLKLYAPKREGYKRHWANDVNGRVDELLQRGYTIVQPSGDTKSTRVRSGSKDGKEVYAVLMEIPQDWYDEDYQRRQKDRVDSKENAIFGSSDGKQADNGYVSSNDNKISHGNN